MILEPIPPKLLATRRIPRADPAVLRAYGADPDRHVALGLVTCDQDDALYVALDEATKHAPRHQQRPIERDRHAPEICPPRRTAPATRSLVSKPPRAPGAAAITQQCHHEIRANRPP